MQFLKRFYSYTAFFILAALFNLLCFISREDYTTGFYVSFAFGNFSLLLCVLTAALSSKKRQVMLVYSYYYLTSIYEIIAVLLNLIFIWTGLENIKVNIAINAVIACIFLALIFMSLAADADSNLKAEAQNEKLNYHYDMVDYVAPLRDRGKSNRINKKIESFYDAVSNSQINTENAEVYIKDQNIISAANKIEELLNNEGQEDEIIRQLDSAIKLVDERNLYIQRSIMRGV